MLRLYLLFYILNWMTGSDDAYLNHAEANITLELIEEFNINYCIFISDYNYNNMAHIHHSKNFMSKWSIPVSFFKVEQVYNKVVDESFFNVLTMMLLKIKDLKVIIDLLMSLKNVKKLQNMRKFLWVVFVDWTPGIRKEQELLLVPYDCEFIMVHLKDSSYQLVEVYKLTNKTIFYDYGTWDEKSGFTKTELSMYRRRNNLNNTKFLFVSDNPDIWVCDTIRQCAHNKVLMDLANMSNFEVVPVRPTELKEVYNLEEGDAYNKMAYFHPAFAKYNQLAPLFRIIVNWYIEDPVDTRQADYYIRVFHLDLWLSILATIIVGAITFTIIHTVLKNFTNGKMYEIAEGALIVLYYFCDQDTSVKHDSITFRVATLAYRLITMVIVPAYSATITAFLAVRIPVIPFRDLKSFVENGEYLLGVIPTRYPYKYFKKSPDPLLKRIFNKFLVTINETDAVQRLCTDKFSFVSPHNDIYKNIAECSFYEIEEPITYVDTAIDLATDTPYRSILRHNLIKIFSSGVHKKLHLFLLGEVKKKEKQDFQSVEIEQMFQIFSMVAAGAALGLIMLILELAVNFFRNRKSRRRKKKRNLSVNWIDDIGAPSKGVRHSIVDDFVKSYMRKLSDIERKFSIAERKYSVISIELM